MRRFESFLVEGLSVALLLISSVLFLPSVAKAGSDSETRGHLSKADYEFALTAAKGGILEVALDKIAAEKPTVRQEQKIERFRSLRNEAFDREYVSLMMENHEKNLKVFQRTARKGENTALRNFAAETSLVVEGHLSAARSLTSEIR